ncbi:MAG: hypothetical protein IJX72_07355, partial [Clostridia bacterium]|nr:hypothetical protein [Clostridia bacterium]
MKKYILLLATLVAVLVTVCLSFASCDIEDLLDPITSDTGTETENENKTDTDTETEIPDEAPWFPPETDGTTPSESESEDVTDDPFVMPISPDELEEIEAPLFNLVASYVQDEYLFLRAEHLSVSGLNVTYPAILRISDLAAWKNFYVSQNSDGGVVDGELLKAFDLLNEEFFSAHSLLVLVTEGRSGS